MEIIRTTNESLSDSAVDGTRFEAKGNSAQDWNLFDATAYADINYAALLEGDAWLYRFGINCYKSAGVRLKSLGKVIDLGNGGVAAGPGLMAPLVKDDGVIEWTDIGRQQLATARRTVEAGRQGFIGLWTPHQEIMEDIDSDWTGCIQRGCSLGEVLEMSAFDVPEDKYDSAHARFVHESFTDKPEEHEQGLISMCRAVKLGGPVLIFGMDGSTGYDSAGNYFPAVSTNAEHTLGIVAPYLTNTRTTFISVDHGVRPDESETEFRGFFGVFGTRNDFRLAA